MYQSRAVAAFSVLLGAAFALPRCTYAQAARGSDDGRSERSGRRENPDPVYDEREPSPQETRDYGFPDPDRPWGRPRYLDSYYQRPRSYLKREARPRRYHWYYEDDYTYRFGPRRYGDRTADDVERAYRQGVADGQSYERFEIQAERGLATYRRAMADGHSEFEAGRYEVAARHFLLAATVNQGDPASRLCAAHAHFALGEYEPAVRLLRRAFELQPKWLYLPMDIRGAYGNLEDFSKHLTALRRAADQDAGNAILWLLLGYCHYFSGDVKGAIEMMTNAMELEPKDEFLLRLADLVGLAPTRSGELPQRRKSQRTAHDL